MKKSLFGLLSLLVLGSSAHAALPRNNVRLQYVQSPNRIVFGGTTTLLSVLANGRVIESYQSALPRPLPVREVARLDAYQMDRIDRLINQARRGRIVTTNSQIRCLAISQFKDTFTADNGRVFLKKGAMCENYTYNTSRAAQQLVTLLQNLKNRN